VIAVVSRRRRAQIATIVERMPNAHRQPVLNVPWVLAEAGGEVPEQDRSLGWDLDR
jgi:hypothetical protein